MSDNCKMTLRQQQCRLCVNYRLCIIYHGKDCKRMGGDKIPRMRGSAGKARTKPPRMESDKNYLEMLAEKVLARYECTGEKIISAYELNHLKPGEWPWKSAQ